MARAIRITQCSDPQRWYADQVGKLVPLIRAERDYYISREPAGFTNVVLKADAEPVDLEVSKEVA